MRKNGSRSAGLRSLVPLAVMLFMIRYRRTVIGPLWLVAAPALFVLAIGSLYSEISNRAASVFIPHLALGLVLWNITGAFFAQTPIVFVRNRSNIKQAGLSQGDVCKVEVINQLLILLVQALLIAAVFFYFRISLHAEAWLVLPGLALITLNCYWSLRVFGILGARYQDVGEAIQALMRVGFLATPVIWMPGPNSDRGALMNSFLNFNPFYHFIELIRAPMLGNPVDITHWIFAGVVTAAGFVVMVHVTRQLEDRVALWV